MNRRAISDNKQRSAHEDHKMSFYPESKGEGLIDLKTREEELYKLQERLMFQNDQVGKK